MRRGGAWTTVEFSGSVRALHSTPAGFPARREFRVMRPASAAVVLGSGQRPDVVDAAAVRQRNLAILRRRSGGGVVLVTPGDLLWVDVVVPRGDPLWHPDVGRAFIWLGRAFQRALADCGVEAEVHERPYEAGRWGSLVCYAGRGPGEVFVAGRKVVGLAQRRTRDCARFQAGLVRGGDPAELAAVLSLPESERAALAADLADSVAGAAVGTDRLLGALSRSLEAAEPPD